MRGPVRLGARLPWGDPGFSARMLAEHLDQRHDLASRRTAVIDAQAQRLAALSTLAGVRRKAGRALRWYTAAGGLFGAGPHAVLQEAAWFEAERATAERWWVLRDGAARPRAFGTTRWAHDQRLPGALADAGLRIEDRYGDACGSPHDPHADFETFVLVANRHD